MANIIWKSNAVKRLDVMNASVCTDEAKALKDLVEANNGQCVFTVNAVVQSERAGKFGDTPQIVMVTTNIAGEVALVKTSSANVISQLESLFSGWDEGVGWIKLKVTEKPTKQGNNAYYACMLVDADGEF